MVSRPLRPPNGCPLAYPRQILDGDTEIVPCGLLNNGLANIVIYPGLEARLTPLNLFEPALCGFSSNRLKDSATAFIPLALGFKLFAREHFAITCHSDVDYAEVYSKPAVRIIGIRGLNFTALMQKEHAVPINEVGLSQAIFKHLSLMVAANKLNVQATLNGPDRDPLLVFGFPREDALIVGNGSQWLEGSLSLAVKLVGISHASNSPYNNLRREIGKLFSGVVISELVEGILSKSLGFPSTRAQVVAGFISTLDGALQRIGLLFGWLKLNLCYQFHRANYSTIRGFVKYGKGAGRLLPTASSGVSAA